MTLLGIAILWRAGKHAEVRWSTRTFVGSMILGGRLFNLVEGVIAHHILNLHHEVERLGVSVFDYAFLGSGVLFILIGWGAIRSGKKQDAEHLWHPGMVQRSA